MRGFMVNLGVVVALVVQSSAQGAILSAGQVLRIEFSTTPPTVPETPDVLYVFLGEIDRLEPYDFMTGSLYDGDDLLGTSNSENGCCGTGLRSNFPAPVTWKGPGSPWDFPAGDPATVDFTTLLNGSIRGRIDISINAGKLDLSLDAVAVRWIAANSANGGSSIPPDPVIESVSIVPEPGSAVLMMGLGVWGMRGRGKAGIRAGVH